MDLENNLEIKNLFFNQKVVLAYIFGSKAEGTSTPLSDIDIGVLISLHISPTEYARLKIFFITELMKILKTNKIDIVILNEGSPLLKYEIIRYGKVIFNINEDLRIDFETKAIEEYLDTKKIRQVQNSYYLERMAGAAA